MRSSQELTHKVAAADRTPAFGCVRPRFPHAAHALAIHRRRAKPSSWSRAGELQEFRGRRSSDAAPTVFEYGHALTRLAHRRGQCPGGRGNEHRDVKRQPFLPTCLADVPQAGAALRSTSRIFGIRRWSAMTAAIEGRASAEFLLNAEGSASAEGPLDAFSIWVWGVWGERIYFSSGALA